VQFRGLAEPLGDALLELPFVTPRTLTRPGQPALAYYLSPPEGAQRGSVLLLHGYAEHQGRYAHVVSRWTARGLYVVGLDLRGHGASEGRRGHVHRFSDYVDDANALVAELQRDPIWTGSSTRAPVIFGHSLGGLIASHVVLSGVHQFSGLGLSSPFYGLALRVAWVRKILGRAMSRVWPTYSEAVGIRDDKLTHDARRVQERLKDPLIVRRVTARWFTEALHAHRVLEDSVQRLALRVFCQAAGEDRVADVEATKRLLPRAPGPVELRVLEGLYHEVLNELDPEPIIDAYAERFVAWLSDSATS